MNTNNQSYQRHTLNRGAAHITVRRDEKQRQQAFLWFLASGIGLILSLGIGRLLLG